MNAIAVSHAVQLNDLGSIRRKEIGKDKYNILKKTYKLYLRHKIPDYNSNIDKISGIWNNKRTDLIEISSFPYLSKSWIHPLAYSIGEYKCLEVGAGLGALSKCLYDCGTDIIATDNYSYKYQGLFSEDAKPWFDIENIDAADAVEKYMRDRKFLIMSWPPYNNNMAYNCLMKLRQVNPDAIIIYIGEWKNGCSANDKFFNNVQVLENEMFYRHVSSKYKSYFGIYDDIYLLR